MALLAAEPDATLDLSADLDLSGDARLWVVQATPTHDFPFARDLRKWGLAHYAPRALDERHDPRRKQLRRRVVPLFSSYAFLYGDLCDVWKARQSPYCCGHIEVFDQRRLLFELRQVDQLLRSGRPVAPEPELHAGQFVRVLSGPFRGVVGTVARVASRDRLIVHVETLGQRVGVEFENWAVEAVGC